MFGWNSLWDCRPDERLYFDDLIVGRLMEGRGDVVVVVVVQCHLMTGLCLFNVSQAGRMMTREHSAALQINGTGDLVREAAR